MKIRALMAVAIVEASTGNIISIPHGGIAEISDELAESLIHDGIAEEYILISPTGTVSITENGTFDVTDYASANVNVKDYSDFKARSDGSLTEVTAEMLDGVTTISNFAFYKCANLISVDIPSSVTSIGNVVFYDCTSLTSVTIPSSVTSIGQSAFYGCASLTSVTVEATTPPTLGSSAFSDTSGNLVIYVPSSSVGTYKAASGWSTYASRIQAIPST